MEEIRSRNPPRIGQIHLVEEFLPTLKGDIRDIGFPSRLRDAAARVSLLGSADLLPVVKGMPFIVRAPFVLAPPNRHVTRPTGTRRITVTKSDAENILVESGKILTTSGIQE